MNPNLWNKHFNVSSKGIKRLRLQSITTVTLCVLMDSTNTDKCNKDWVFHWSDVRIPNYNVFNSLKIVLTSPKSVNPDEMQLYAKFHLGLHCQSTRLGVSLIQKAKFVSSVCMLFLWLCHNPALISEVLYI